MRYAIRALLTLCFAATPLFPQVPEAGEVRVPLDSAEAILETFAEDYERDPSLREVRFAVSLDEEAWWQVVAEPGEEGDVTVTRGRPDEPTLVFWLHYPTLVRMHRGELDALTAAGRGLASDPALLSYGATEGYTPTPETVEILQDVLFHFWTRGLPEVVPFDARRTRRLHGTDAVLLYYQPGFRSAWFSMKPGQHANEDPRLQVNPFPSLIVITRGRGAGRIGDRELELDEGNAVFIPAGTSHEFWNPFDEPVEGLLLMFGEGS